MPAKRSNIHNLAPQTNLRREIFGGVDTDSVIMVEMSGVGNADVGVVNGIGVAVTDENVDVAEEMGIDVAKGNAGVGDTGIRTETFRKSTSLNALGGGMFGRSDKSDTLDDNGHGGGRSIGASYGTSETVSSSSKIRKEREGMVVMFCGSHFEPVCGPITASLELNTSSDGSPPLNLDKSAESDEMDAK